MATSEDRNDIQNVKKLSIQHFILTEITQLSSEFFGYNVLLLLGLNFVYIVFDTFYILDFFLGYKGIHGTQTNLIVYACVQLFSYSLQIILFAEFANLYVRENYEIGRNLHKLLTLKKCDFIKLHLKYFIGQWQDSSIHFSCAGLFKLERSFYLKVGFD